MSMVSDDDYREDDDYAENLPVIELDDDGTITMYFPRNDSDE